jgi:hypothetical protein
MSPWLMAPILVVAVVVLVPTLVFTYMWMDGGRANSPRFARGERLPGDDLLLPTDRFMRLQEEVTIDAPRERVWPILAQLGTRKGGWMALAWLERLFTFHIYNTDERVEAWQDLAPGDFLFYHQAGVGSQIIEVEPGRYFTSLSDTRRPPTYQGAFALLPPFGLQHFAWNWNFVLQDLPDGQTRFVNRCDVTWEPFDKFWPKALILVILGSPSVFMVRRMLLKTKKLAEGRQRPSVVNGLVRSMAVWSDQARPRTFADISTPPSKAESTR